MIYDVPVTYSVEARRKLCTQSCKANDWEKYNSISLISVMVWIWPDTILFYFSSFTNLTCLLGPIPPVP